MKTLVIGATGYIGGAIVQRLLAHRHDVTALVRSGSESKLASGVPHVTGDVSQPETLATAAAAADVVVYSVQYSAADQFDAESAALRALCDALAPTGKALIYTSGVWMYGSTYPTAADEEASENPPAIVARRPELEMIVRDACARGLRGVIVRPADVYGKGGGIPAMWVQSAKSEGAARIVGEGRNHWPMVHVEDLAELYRLAIERATSGAIYNVADDSRLTVREMAEAASRGQGKGGAVTVWPLDEARGALGVFADALVLDQAVSAERAKRELGWSPRSTTALDDLEHGSYAAHA